MTSGDEPANVTQAFEAGLARQGEHRYELRLYVTGMTPRSQRAIMNLREICETYLHGRYDLQVIDVYQHPDRLAGENILALPTLIKALPPPLRRIIGDLSNRERVLAGLDLHEVRA